MSKFLLFTPGPVNVADNVRTAIAGTDICHREVEFEHVFRRIETRLLLLFEIRNPENYQAVVITGSGSAANEALLSSVVDGQTILVVSNGEFGERLHTTSEIYNEHTVHLRFPWGSALDLTVIDEHLRQNPVDVLAVVHHETSSGMLNPLEAIGKLAASHDVALLVDCVSSAGAESIDMERDNIAFCSASSSKAIGSYPGLSFVIGRIDEFEKLATARSRTSYLNLHTFFTFARDRSQTPNTPAVPLFYALDQALENILAETVAGRRAAIRRTATRLREGMQTLGLTFLLDVDEMSSVLTTVCLPRGVDIDRLRHELRARSIIIYEGKGHLRGAVFQVGCIGELSEADVRTFLRSLKSALSRSRVDGMLPPADLLRRISERPAGRPAVETAQ